MLHRTLRLAWWLGLATLAVWSSAIAASAAKGRPDLVETVISDPPPVAATGSTMRVVDTVLNRGRRRAPRSTTVYYLSADRRADRADARAGKRRIGRLKPRRISRAAVTVRVPATIAPSRYYLIACADAGHTVRESNERKNCRASTHGVKIEDRTPPHFAGLTSAGFSCIQFVHRSYWLRWSGALDNVSPAILYDIYQATSPGGEDFTQPTYTTHAGATDFMTPPLLGDKTYYFVVRARDGAGNRDSNRVERQGQNYVCGYGPFPTPPRP